MSGIYVIKNIKNNKLYVGKTIKDFEKRWKEHVDDLEAGKHYNKHLQRAWDKYGKNNFTFSVLEEIENDNTILEQQEVYWIKQLDSKRNGYNQTDGGNGAVGFVHSHETKMRISSLAKERAKKSPMSNETRTKISNSKIGKKLSDEIKQKMSESKKGSNNSFYGKSHSDETKLKISLSKKGKSINSHPDYNGAKNPRFNKKRKNTSSTYMGVCYSQNKSGSMRWSSRVRLNSKDIFSKYFKTEFEAIIARDIFVLEHNLENKLNFPKILYQKKIFVFIRIIYMMKGLQNVFIK